MNTTLLQNWSVLPRQRLFTIVALAALGTPAGGCGGVTSSATQAGGSAGVDAGGSAGTSVGGGGSGAVGGTGASGGWTSCTESSECTLFANNCCGGYCQATSLSSFTALSWKDVSQFEAQNCSTNVACPDCVSFPQPDYVALCVAGSCTRPRCALDQTDCGGQCVDIASSPQHCGGCNQPCGANAVCSEGRCVAGCAAGLTLCGQSCVDLARDRDHCGKCNEACGADEVCARVENKPTCRGFQLAGCNHCPCKGCGERTCCVLANAKGALVAVCIEGRCPADAAP